MRFWVEINSTAHELWSVRTDTPLTKLLIWQALAHRLEPALADRDLESSRMFELFFQRVAAYRYNLTKLANPSSTTLHMCRKAENCICKLSHVSHCIDRPEIKFGVNIT